MKEFEVGNLDQQIAPEKLIDPRDGALICPECGGNYSHVNQVFTRPGSDPGEATVYEGTVAGEGAAGRRSALVIELDGECQHSWRIVIQQHKGNNFVAVESWQRRENAEPE